LLRVTALVARTAPSAEVFDAVTAEAAALIDDEATTLVRYEGGRTFRVLSTCRGPAPVGTRFTVPDDDEGTMAQLMRTLRPARQDRYDAIAPKSYSNKEYGVGSSVSVPVFVDGRLWGAIGTLNEGRRLPEHTEERLATFAELVTTALANVEARAEIERFGLEQAALRRVAELAAGGAAQEDVLEAVAAEASALLGSPVGVVADAPVPAPRARGEGTARADDGGSADDAGVRVPVLVDGRPWGALVAYARPWPLPPRAAEQLTPFAQVAGIAVAGHAAREALRHLAVQQAALRRVAEMVARGAALDEVLRAVAAEASSLLADTSTHLARYDEEDGVVVATVVATCNSPVPLGLRAPADEGTVTAAVLHTRRPVRVRDFTGNRMQRLTGELGVTSLVVVPVLVEERVWGLLGATGGAVPLPDDTEERLTEFAELAAAALASAENKAALRASRARIVATADETRQRMQRDVHDGVQQRLVQTVLTLQLALQAADRREPTGDLVREALSVAELATGELRDLVQGILPASLTRGGLRAGLESLIAGMALPVDLEMAAEPPGRLPREVEVTAYFVVAEALTNVVKHARASRARVVVPALAPSLVVEVSDDGAGGAAAGRGGTGLIGLQDRVDALNGTLELTSPASGGTTLRVSLPIGT
jgi:signal transduction histidine kinase